jgi:hypothetical protein
MPRAFTKLDFCMFYCFSMIEGRDWGEKKPCTAGEAFLPLSIFLGNL